MTDDELLRYSRHILLDDIGIEGQERWLHSHALIIGAGGLGSPAALYLTAAGVGHITIADADAVDLTNLQRQIAHTQDRVGTNKARSVAQAALALNSQVKINAVEQRVDAAWLDALVPTVQVVLDCTDNFATRHAINAACVKHQVPLVSGAAIRFDAQLAVFDARQANTPCYACIYPADQPSPDALCATMGVISPLVGMVGAWQALEALKLLAVAGSAPTGRLLMFNALRTQWDELRVNKRNGCSVCASS
jgi:molybdopterin/thiamine biosynthesis adenylyltransferase